MIDLHCHILPGVDDGARTLEEALDMALMAEKEGVQKIVATPHLFRDNYNLENFAVIEAKRGELSRALKKNNIAVEVLPGAEVHISHNLLDTIRKNRQNLVLNQSSYMFVEFPASHVFSGAKNLFFALMNEGIMPIIAHPERNAVFIQNPVILYELIQMGALAQANTGSFLGLYGDRTGKAVLQFLELHLIHFIGSDSHSPNSLSCRLREAMAKVELIVGKEQTQALVNDNPSAVINDQELPFLLTPTNPREKEKSFNIKIPRIFRGNKQKKGLEKQIKD
jgi:protein-tyrosine phosphatase